MFVAALLLAAAPPVRPMITEPAVRRWDGPALVCGEAFALRLAAGERVTRRDPMIDFIL
jgi:hypothetical protein